MSFIYKENISEICDFIKSSTISIFEKLSTKTTDDAILTFHFFMLVRLRDAFFGMNQLIKADTVYPLFYSFSNLLRPILMDAAFASSLNQRLIKGLENNDGFFAAHNLINAILKKEANLMRNFAEKFQSEDNELGSDLLNYEEELLSRFQNKFPGQTIQNENISIDRIFLEGSKESKNLREIWHVYKVFSQMTHLNDFYGELQRKSVEEKMSSVLTGAILSIDHFIQIIENISLLPEHQESIIDEYKRLLQVSLDLKLKIIFQ